MTLLITGSVYAVKLIKIIGNGTGGFVARAL